MISPREETRSFRRLAGFNDRLNNKPGIAKQRESVPERLFVPTCYLGEKHCLRPQTSRVSPRPVHYLDSNQPPCPHVIQHRMPGDMGTAWPLTADPLLPDDRGRRHLTMAASATEQSRPCRRVLTPGFSGADDPRAQGLLRIEPTPRVPPRPTGLLTNAEALRRSGYDIPDPGLVVRPV